MGCVIFKWGKEAPNLFRLSDTHPSMEGDSGLEPSSSAAGTSHCKRLEQMLSSRWPYHHLLRLSESEKLAVSVDWCSNGLISVIFPLLLKVVQSQAHGSVPLQGTHETSHTSACILAMCFASVGDFSMKALGFCYVVPWSGSQVRETLARSKACYFAQRKNRHMEEYQLCSFQ